MKRWIVIDGLDGSGKSTVASWIKEYYEARGESVHVQVHPSDRWTGRMSRRALQGKGALLFALSTAFYVTDILISVAKMRGEPGKFDDLVFVRYLMGTAYLPKRIAKQGYTIFSKVLPVPERLLLVDIEPENALHRIALREDREEMFENLPSLEKSREKMLMLSEGWDILDNNGEEDATRRMLNERLEAWDRVYGVAGSDRGCSLTAAEGDVTSG